MRVGRRNQDNATFEQAIQQAAQDHRIADIADEKFVKAKYARLLGNADRNLVERVLDETQGFHALMHVVHHAMKVDAFFLLDIEALVKQVHEERLASADATPKVESTYGLARLAPEEHCAQA